MNDLEQLRAANSLRQQHWAGSAAANDIEFRTIEFVGEAGEVANAVKKLLRFDRGIAGNKGQSREELVAAIKEEIGDILITLDLFAAVIGVDLREAMIEKFNKTSVKVGIPIFLMEAPEIAA